MTRGLPRPLSTFIAAVVVASLLPGLASSPAGAGPPDPVFTPLAGFRAGDDARVAPRRSAAYRVDLEALAGQLGRAPSRAEVARGGRTLSFSVPDPSGRMTVFRVQETRVLQKRLASRHPKIRTWAGVGVTDPTTTIRLDLTPMGFHASVIGTERSRSWYVDPAYNRPGTTTHLSYLRSAVPAPERPFLEPDLDALAESVTGPTPAPRAGAVVSRRTFRLAFVTDPTYAAYFGSGNVLAEKTTLINRVNQVYNSDLAIEMVLVNGTEQLNLDTAAKATLPNGPCGANACYEAADLSPDTGGCSGGLLDRNEFVLGQIIGADKFDVGHIGLGINGGGIAGLGVVGERYKADGCTGLPFPKGDFYAIDYVAHEIGHQFAGNHTFNGTLANCSLTNRSGGASVEPGSGSSVMAYAGICGRDDLQPHTDPYFSQRSIDEITTHVTSAPSTYDEQQVVNLRGYDAAGETFQLTYPGATPVTLTRGNGGNYTSLGISQAVQQLSGVLPEVSGYDGASLPSTAGFTLAFETVGSGTNLATFGVVGGAGVSGFVGTIYDGGPGTNRGVTTATGNHAPVVTAPADATLPVRTPFTLTASGSDQDGNPLSYLWEQNDQGGLSPTGGTALLSNTKANGPLFRVFGVAAQVGDDDSLESPSPGQNHTTSDPSRTFPDLAQVLAGNTNADTGSCPTPPAEPAEVPQSVIDCFSEFLPTAGYGDPVLGGELNFRVTARDGVAAGGGTAYDDVTLSVDPGAGPFQVTSRATAGDPAEADTTETLTWAVNGTDDPALAPTVRISLSTDGGLTYPTVLAATTPNDGSELITWPRVSTSQARIRIEAVGNYFFDVNDADFTVVSPLAVTEPEPQTLQYSDDFGAPVGLTATSQGVDGDQLTAQLTGVDGLTVTRGTTSADGVRPGTAQLVVAGPVTATPGEYDAVVTVTEPGPDGVEVELTFPVTVEPEDASVTWAGPTTVTGSESSATVPLSTTVSDPADGDRGDITRATVTFVDRGTGEELCSAPVTGGPTSGSAACDAALTRDGDSTAYTIGTVVGGDYLRDSQADDTLVTLTSGDASAPETVITGGPSEGSFHLKKKATVRFDGGPGATAYACVLDGRSVTCSDGSAKLRKLSTGSHVFEVAARDASGSVDPSPARLTFVSPFNDRQLNRSGRWKRHRAKSAYRGTWLDTKRDGAGLSRKGRQITEIALVVGTTPGAGKVAVFFRGKRVAKVSLRGARHGTVLIPVTTLNRPRSGVVRIETLGRRPVRIEGLALR